MRRANEFKNQIHTPFLFLLAVLQDGSAAFGIKFYFPLLVLSILPRSIPEIFGVKFLYLVLKIKKKNKVKIVPLDWKPLPLLLFDLFVLKIFGPPCDSKPQHK